MPERTLFKDRRAAGRELADRLQSYRDTDPLILGIPRGGVPLAFEVAQELHAELDVLVVRKIGAPDQPEFGIGAVAPGGVTVHFDRALQSLGVSDETVRTLAKQERAILRERIGLYRGHEDPPQAKGRTVILIDDGLATGVTARAAVASAHRLQPARIVLAVPVCATDASDALSEHVDELVCLHASESFGAVGVWYEHFAPTSDEEVIELLEEAHDAVSDEDLREPG